MIKNFVKILELLGDCLEVCVSVCLQRIKGCFMIVYPQFPQQN